MKNRNLTIEKIQCKHCVYNENCYTEQATWGIPPDNKCFKARYPWVKANSTHVKLRKHK